MFARNGFSNKTSAAYATEATEGIGGLVHEAPEQEIQGGTDGEHYHLTADEHAFVSGILTDGFIAKLPEPVMATAELALSGSGDCMMAWGGEYYTYIDPPPAPVPPPLPPGVVDARFYYEEWLPAEDPGAGMATQIMDIGIRNYNTGVTSPIPGGVTFTLTIQTGFGDTYNITYTTPFSIASASVISDMRAQIDGNPSMSGEGYVTAPVDDSTFRITCPANSVVNYTAAPSSGEWRLNAYINVLGSAGAAGHNVIYALKTPTGSLFFAGERLIIELPDQTYTYTVTADAAGSTVLPLLATDFTGDGTGQWIGPWVIPPYSFVSLQAVNGGTYDTFPYVFYEPTLLVGSAGE